MKKNKRTVTVGGTCGGPCPCRGTHFRRKCQTKEPPMEGRRMESSIWTKSKCLHCRGKGLGQGNVKAQRKDLKRIWVQEERMIELFFIERQSMRVMISLGPGVTLSEFISQLLLLLSLGHFISSFCVLFVLFVKWVQFYSLHMRTDWDNAWDFLMQHLAHRHAQWALAVITVRLRPLACPCCQCSYLFPGSAALFYDQGAGATERRKFCLKVT